MNTTCEKVRAGQPYLYRKNGLPSEVYEVRMRSAVDGDALQSAVDKAMARYPYFKVRYQEHAGDFYAEENALPLYVHETDAYIPLGGRENNFYLIGVTYHGAAIDVSFHHGLSDGRGVKSFVETLIWYYCREAFGSAASSEGVLTCDDEFAEHETAEPCGEKYEVDRTQLDKIAGISRKGFALPETKLPKDGHRRFELKFPQSEFMAVCKECGASPVVLLSVMMSRAIHAMYPAHEKPINSNFPVDARAVLGCEGTYKNCVKSISLPFGDAEQAMPVKALCGHYKSLMNAQREPERCKDEFNKIIMLLDAVSHLHSFSKKRAVMRFLDDLKLDTYLISYVGQFTFNENEAYVESVHLFSDCADGLVLNMTCQCGYFCIDFVQDFEGAQYANALTEQLSYIGIEAEMSGEILFTTPCDHLMRDMPADTVPAETFMQKTIRVNAGAYTAIENAFVRAFLCREGETVGEAKLRLADEQIIRITEKREAIAKQMYIA